MIKNLLIILSGFLMVTLTNARDINSYLSLDNMGSLFLHGHSVSAPIAISGLSREKYEAKVRLRSRLSPLETHVFINQRFLDNTFDETTTFGDIMAKYPFLFRGTVNKLLPIYINNMTKRGGDIWRFGRPSKDVEDRLRRGEVRVTTSYGVVNGEGVYRKFKFAVNFWNVIEVEQDLEETQTQIQSLN